MSKQQIIDRIMKVKALADRGTDGERTAAQRLLEEMMEKYHIDEIFIYPNSSATGSGMTASFDTLTDLFEFRDRQTTYHFLQH